MSTTTGAPAPPATPPEGPGASREIRRQRGLPGGRALVGGLLVAVAAIGVFVAYLDATAAPTTEYVVATSDLEPGARVQPADLGTVALDLPGDVAGELFTEPGDVIGQVATAPLGARELVGDSAVADPGDEEARTQMSFSVAASRALGDRIAPGERVDVLATYGDDCTARVLSDVAVLARTGADAVTFTLALDEPEQALALANAVDSAEVTVTRTTEVDPEPTGECFAPPGAG